MATHREIRWRLSLFFSLVAVLSVFLLFIYFTLQQTFLLCNSRCNTLNQPGEEREPWRGKVCVVCVCGLKCYLHGGTIVDVGLG